MKDLPNLCKWLVAILIILPVNYVFVALIVSTVSTAIAGAILDRRGTKGYMSMLSSDPNAFTNQINLVRSQFCLELFQALGMESV
jgi:hypothetical protein